MTITAKIIILSIASSIIAQLAKFIISIIRTKNVDPTMLITTGSMPSSHSALVTTLLTSIGLFSGINEYFAIALVLAMVVIHDSFGVRYQASKHARLLNEIRLRLNLIENIQVEEKKLKESLGHKPKEVLVGILLGASIAVIGWLILGN